MAVLTTTLKRIGVFDEYQAKQPITIYWWNMGTKTLDFKGTIAEYLKMKGFKVTKVIHPFQKDITGLRFKVALSSCVITLDTYEPNHFRAATDAITLFLTMLGDRALIFSNYSTININN